jgi:hypothetical protein
MNDCRSRNFGLALLCIAAAPLLLFASVVAVLTSRIANAIFGHDPAAPLLEQHPKALTILTLTGRCALGFLAAGLLFRGAI